LLQEYHSAVLNEIDARFNLRPDIKRWVIPTDSREALRFFKNNKLIRSPRKDYFELVQKWLPVGHPNYGGEDTGNIEYTSDEKKAVDRAKSIAAYYLLTEEEVAEFYALLDEGLIRIDSQPVKETYSESYPFKTESTTAYYPTFRISRGESLGTTYSIGQIRTAYNEAMKKGGYTSRAASSALGREDVKKDTGMSNPDYVRRNGDAAVMDTIDQRLNHSLSFIEEMIRRIRLKGRPDRQPVVYDIGIGWNSKEGPVPTIELAEAMEGEAEVIGMDNRIPAYVVRYGMKTALFDEDDNLITLYFSTEWYTEETIPAAEKEHLMDIVKTLKSEALWRRPLNRLSSKVRNKTMEHTNSQGYTITFNPVQRYEGENLKFFKQNVFNIGEAVSKGSLPKADIARIANVLTLYYEPEAIQRALVSLLGAINEDGYVLIGHSHNMGFRTEEYLVYKKKGDRFILEDYMFSTRTGGLIEFGANSRKFWSPVNAGEVSKNIMDMLRAYYEAGEFNKIYSEKMDLAQELSYTKEIAEVIAGGLSKQGVPSESVAAMIMVKIDPSMFENIDQQPEIIKAFKKSYLDKGVPLEVKANAAAASAIGEEKTSSPARSTPGGIDLSPANFNINVSGSSSGIATINLPFDVNDFGGFTFQIIKISDIDDIESVLLPSGDKVLSKSP
ncbi:MAG: hypothetical protein ABH858_03135, partial [Candidatus Omnitrophota bacterium]